jgi:hypothetical protein
MADVWELIEDDTDAPFSKVNFCMALLSTSTAVDMMGLSKHGNGQDMKDLPIRSGKPGSLSSAYVEAVIRPNSALIGKKHCK